MTYPQSFYADLFDKFLADSVKDNEEPSPRAAMIQDVSSKVQRDDGALADRLIANLHQPYQEVLQKYYKEGKSCSQMATEYGITVNGVDYRKRRALRMIRDMIRENQSLTF